MGKRSQEVEAAIMVQRVELKRQGDVLFEENSRKRRQLEREHRDVPRSVRMFSDCHAWQSHRLEAKHGKFLEDVEDWERQHPRRQRPRRRQRGSNVRRITITSSGNPLRQITRVPTTSRDDTRVDDEPEEEEREEEVEDDYEDDYEDIE